MDHLIDLPLWLLWLAAVAAGTVAGALCLAVDCLLIWARGRRT